MFKGLEAALKENPYIPYASLKYFLSIQMIITILLFTGIIIEPTLSKSWYEIYYTLAIFDLFGTLGLIVIAFIAGKKEAHDIELPKYDVYGAADTALKFIIVALIAIPFGILLSRAHTTINFSVFPVAAQSIASLSNLFVLAFIAPDQEENATKNVIVPYLQLILEIVGFGPLLMLMGFIVAVILSTIAVYIGILMFIGGLILTGYEQLETSKRGERFRLISASNEMLNLILNSIVSGIMMSVIFAALHGYAALSEATGMTTFQSILAGAFVFGLTMWALNLIIGYLLTVFSKEKDWKPTSIFSRLAHSSYNAGIYQITYGGGWEVFFVPVFYAILLLVVQKPDKWW